MFKHILIATDGSELASKAVLQGIGLAKTVNAKLTIVMATEPWTAVAPGEIAIGFPIEQYEKGAAAHAAAVLSKVSEEAKAAGMACETVHAANHFPAEAIVEAANTRGCDLIVMASHGRRGLTRLLLGSQAQRVLTQSKVPVLIVR